MKVAQAISKHKCDTTMKTDQKTKHTTPMEFFFNEEQNVKCKMLITWIKNMTTSTSPFPVSGFISLTIGSHIKKERYKI